jgi:flavodoxin
MKALVVYYSRTGNTKFIAETLAKDLNCDIEEIVDNKKRSGVVGSASAYFRPKATTTIKEMKNDPKDYDIVIIGTPIWWYTSTPAVNEFLNKYKQQIKKAAFFYTCGADRNHTTIPDMEKLLDKRPVATLGIEDRAINNGAFKKKLETFVRSVK